MTLASCVTSKGMLKTAGFRNRGQSMSVADKSGRSSDQAHFLCRCCMYIADGFHVLFFVCCVTGGVKKGKACSGC